MSRPPIRSVPLPPPPPEEEHDGASDNERLLAAAKTDNESLMREVLTHINTVNVPDSLGNTALHYAVQNASIDVLELILTHGSCDVDLYNRIAEDTALHIAVRQRWPEHEGMRLYIVGSLLEAGADMFLKNRYGERAIDILPPPSASADPQSDDEKVRAMLRRAEAETLLATSGDVVDEDDEDLIDPDDVASDDD